MNTDFNLEFIRKKIYETRSAIMYNMSDSLTKIPNNIVTAVRVDEEGQLWFLSKRPKQPVTGYEHTFPAQLKLYRKGVLHFLEVNGEAMLVSQALPERKNRAASDAVLLKMKMTSIEYSEIDQKNSQPSTFFEKAYKRVFGKANVHHAAMNQ